MKRGPLLTMIGAVLGAAGGWLYHHQVGCRTGSCAITSNPWGSAAYGALMGALLIGLFVPQRLSNHPSRAPQHNNDNQR